MTIGKRVVLAASCLLALGLTTQARAEALVVDAADGADVASEIVPLAVTAVVDLDYGQGWSMISLPVTPDDATVSGLFGTNALSAFAFEGSYQEVSELSPCQGYWLNLTGAETYTVSGMAVAECAETWDAGWSMMGAPIGTTTAASIEETPAGNILSIFGFEGSYQEATTLVEGGGYWVNLNAAQTLVLTGGTGKLAADVQRDVPLTDSRLVAIAGDNEQTLHLGAAAESMVALPPLPPAGALDARAEVAGVATQRVPTAQQPVDYRLRLQGQDLVLRWDIDASDADSWALVVDGVEQSLVGVGSLSFAEAPQDLWLRYSPATPQQFALMANYPNPFNPSTTIRYELAEAAQVNLAVYDVLGQKVRDLVDMRQSGGAYSVVWDGRNELGQQVANGVYFYEIQAGEFHSIRKMMLAK